AGMGRIEALAPLHDRAVHEVQKIFRDTAAFVVVVYSQDHRGLRVAIGPDRKPLRLRSIGRDGRCIAFQDAQRTIAFVLRGRSCDPFGAGGEEAVSLFFSLWSSEEA